MVEHNKDSSSLNYLLLHISYDGSFFHGSTYQPNVRTVHGVLFETLRKLNVVDHFSSINFVSRTDRGVHALHNIALIKAFRIPSLIAINMNLSRSSDCFAWGLSILDNLTDFKVLKKSYSYYLPLFLVNKELRKNLVENISQRIKDFVGIHDFSAFIKKDKYKRKSVHHMFSADVKSAFNGSALLFDFVGDGFGWEQIRRMIGFLIDKRWFLDSPLEYLDKNNSPLPIKPVPGDFLVLKKIWFSPNTPISYSPREFRGDYRFKIKMFSYMLKHELMKEWRV